MDSNNITDSLAGEEKGDAVIGNLTMVGVFDPDASSGGLPVDWTPEEERKAVWK